MGGIGPDLMTGGLGRDTFVFLSTFAIGTTPFNRDIITGFAVGTDVIDLGPGNANSIVASNHAFAFIGAAGFTSVAGQLRYSAADGLLQGDIDGNSVADFALERSSRPVLLVTDILR